MYDEEVNRRKQGFEGFDSLSVEIDNTNEVEFHCNGISENTQNSINDGESITCVVDKKVTFAQSVTISAAESLNSDDVFEKSRELTEEVQKCVILPSRNMEAFMAATPQAVAWNVCEEFDEKDRDIEYYADDTQSCLMSFKITDLETVDSEREPCIEKAREKCMDNSNMIPITNDETCSNHKVNREAQTNKSSIELSSPLMQHSSLQDHAMKSQSIFSIEHSCNKSFLLGNTEDYVSPSKTVSSVSETNVDNSNSMNEFMPFATIYEDDSRFDDLLDSSPSLIGHISNKSFLANNTEDYVEKYEAFNIHEPINSKKEKGQDQLENSKAIDATCAESFLLGNTEEFFDGTEESAYNSFSFSNIQKQEPLSSIKHVSSNSTESDTYSQRTPTNEMNSSEIHLVKEKTCQNLIESFEMVQKIDEKIKNVANDEEKHYDCFKKASINGTSDVYILSKSEKTVSELYELTDSELRAYLKARYEFVVKELSNNERFKSAAEICELKDRTHVPDKSDNTITKIAENNMDFSIEDETASEIKETNKIMLKSRHSFEVSIPMDNHQSFFVKNNEVCTDFDSKLSEIHKFHKNRNDVDLRLVSEASGFHHKLERLNSKNRMSSFSEIDEDSGVSVTPAECRDDADTLNSNNVDMLQVANSTSNLNLSLNSSDAPTTESYPENTTSSDSETAQKSCRAHDLTNLSLSLKQQTSGVSPQFKIGNEVNMYAESPKHSSMDSPLLHLPIDSHLSSTPPTSLEVSDCKVENELKPRKRSLKRKCSKRHNRSARHKSVGDSPAISPQCSNHSENSSILTFCMSNLGIRPVNILVYAGNDEHRNNSTRNTLKTCINLDR